MTNHESNMQIVSEKLTEDNFHAWKFRITNYLKGKGYWDYVEGANEAPPVIPDIGAFTEHVKSMKDWHQGSAKVMYWLSVNVSHSIVGHIQNVDSPKDAWDNLITFNATNTRARKIQLKNELNTIKKGDLSVNDYTLKIKALCESLSSIGVAVDNDDKVEACLRGLGNAYKQFKTSICTRENIPHFLELSSLLLVEEKSLIDDGAIQTRRNSSKQALYTGSGRGRGCYAQRGGRGNQGQGQQQLQNQQNQYGQQRPMRGRGQFRGTGSPRGGHGYERVEKIKSSD
ncbi:hypothetical protein L7F22_026876 [Adiantum nelumboides]|nr:hypothetical protein [Adiantum nelumboides]